jgi:hypothetical protein
MCGTARMNSLLILVFDPWTQAYDPSRRIRPTRLQTAEPSCPHPLIPLDFIASGPFELISLPTSLLPCWSNPQKVGPTSYVIVGGTASLHVSGIGYSMKNFRTRDFRRASTLGGDWPGVPGRRAAVCHGSRTLASSCT